MNDLEDLPAVEAELIPTRATLLSRLKNWSDQESWTTFFNIYWKLIYRTALKAGLNKEEAEDVVQNTVISVCRRIPDFKYDTKEGSFKCWLVRLTRWRVRDQIRRRLPHTTIARDDSGESWPNIAEDVPESQGPVLEAVWNEEWDRNLLTAAIERVKRLVSPKQYQIFDLHVLQKVP